MPDRVEMWRTVRWVVTLAALLAGMWFVAGQIRGAVSGTQASIERGLDKVLAVVTGSETTIVEGRAEISGTSEIAELSLLEMRMSATRAFENEGFILRYLPTGTKKLIIRGDYRVKAGYRLEPGVSLGMDRGRGVAKFPRAEILSVELIDFDILNEEDGLFNKVQPEDRARLLRELRAQMQQEAARSGMLETVEASLRTRLADLLGAPVSIEREMP